MTRVEPIGNIAPDVCVEVMVDALQLSVTDGGTQVTRASHEVAIALTWAGQFENTGAIKSLMITLKLQEDELPAASVTV